MCLATVATSASVSASVSAWTDYALLFDLLPLALCLFGFLIRAERGFENGFFLLSFARNPNPSVLGEFPMTRLFWLSLVVVLTSHLPIHAQPKKDPPKNFTNSIGMKFAWIPPCTFIMGSPKEEKERQPFKTDETQHKVTLTKGFYMGVYTVTQEQWQAVMGNNPSAFKGEKNLPVERVSWDDCQEFIKKLREKDKKTYRLPTEAEWEYSCRAGTKTPFHFGETISTEQANYDGNFTYGDGTKGVYRKKTTPVGSFPANAWGLHDMHGNVYQWCHDRYGEYPQKDVVDPQGAEKDDARVLRGGSWSLTPLYCRSAFRHRGEPGRRGGIYGFRVCFCLD
jgi:sulfatase modifying factor 1